MTTRTHCVALRICVAVACLSCAGGSWGTFAEGLETASRPRVIVTTDGEGDDQCSMVRFLLYANEWDIQGIIFSSSKHHWKGDETTAGYKWLGMEWLDKQLDAYAQVYPNLKSHDPAYPSPEYLESQVHVGNILLEGDIREATPGSDHVAKILLHLDTSPVWLQAWGGPNTIARALRTIQEQHPERMAEVARKARIFMISQQDHTYQDYIQKEWPGITTLWSAYDSYGGISYRWYNFQSPEVLPYFHPDWLIPNILEQHGPLCSLYPLKKGKYRSEGDSPAFLHLIDTGLHNTENPSWGGWGGRFVPGEGNLWQSADKEGMQPHTILRWAIDFQNDWAARADWCVKNVAEANHPPAAKVVGSLNQRALPGQVVNLAAEPVADPDGDLVTYRWWQYQEAGTASAVAISNTTSTTGASFVVPPEPGRTIHVLLEVTDNGIPPLKRWQRVVFTIQE